jgi:thymidylate synthase (FAD)
MKIITPYTVIETELDGEKILKFLEKMGRTCYKSEDLITEDSARRFIKMIVKNKHESVLEHFNITVRFICNRGTSHQIVRHRIASYSQESTRYCRYSKDKFGNEITFVKPDFYDDMLVGAREAYIKGLEEVEKAYFKMLESGCSPEMASEILPKATKTELVVTMNLRSWRNFFDQRADPHAHPNVRKIAGDLLDDFKANIPVVFDDIHRG